MQRAVALLEDDGRPAGVSSRAPCAIDAIARHAWSVAPARREPAAQAARAQRLALEMSAHEEAERRALEGELHILEAAWRDAEEIAKIADDMFLPDVGGRGARATQARETRRRALIARRRRERLAEPLLRHLGHQPRRTVQAEPRRVHAEVVVRDVAPVAIPVRRTYSSR